MDKKRMQSVLDLLDEHYGIEHICYLNNENDWQLLIATQLSAQCTDERVNKVTPELFKEFPSIKAFAEADVRDIEKAIYTTGFYRNKAKNIKGCCELLLTRHGGEVPIDIEALLNLPGVGRKTANVVLGHQHNIPAIVVDTHVKRISNKLGFTSLQDPVKIEYDLMKKIPKEHWLRYNTQIIAHGRTLCTARSPKCNECFLLQDCPTGLKILYQTMMDHENKGEKL
jgi:endonuclease-3